jgi:hypothetical protein
MAGWRNPAKLDNRLGSLAAVKHSWNLNRIPAPSSNDPLLTLVRTVYRASVIPAKEDETDASCATAIPASNDVTDARLGSRPNGEFAAAGLRATGLVMR